jgi:hypothetical protein
MKEHDHFRNLGDNELSLIEDASTTLQRSGAM